jgi:hypothetical protein
MNQASDSSASGQHKLAGDSVYHISPSRQLEPPSARTLSSINSPLIINCQRTHRIPAGPVTAAAPRPEPPP